MELPTAHISEVPNELIHQVVKDLEFEDRSLVNFASTCQRFYSTVLEYKRQQIARMKASRVLELQPPPGGVVTDDHSGIGPGTQVTYRLRPEFFQDFWCLHNHIHESKIKFILDLTPTRSLSAKRITRLLTYLVERPWSCLDICGEIEIEGLGRARDRLKGNASWSSIRGPQYLPSIAPAITAMGLDSMMLFSTTLLPLTLNVLNGASITQLVLKVGQSVRSTSEWSKILPCITLRNLTHLEIIDDHSKVQFSDVAKFLARHRALESLTLSNRGSRVQPAKPPPSLPKLPKLKKISGHPAYVVRFLDSVDNFTDLQEIHLLQKVDCNLVLTSLSKIQAKSTRSFTLVLESLEFSCLFPWFLNALGTESSSPGSVSIPSVRQIFVCNGGYEELSARVVSRLLLLHTEVSQPQDAKKYCNFDEASSLEGQPRREVISAHTINIFPNLTSFKCCVPNGLHAMD